MTPVIAPFRQGELDGLCGVYAIVNALRLAFEHRSEKLRRGEWQELFFALLAKVDDGVGGVCHVIANGMSAKRLRTVAKVAERHLRDECEFDVSIELMFTHNDHPSMAELFAAIASSTDRGDPVVVDFAGRLNHWTVIRDVTGSSLLLFDSGGLTRVARRNCQLLKYRGSRRHLHSLSTQSILRVRCLWR
jgi:hypothetical protein